MGEVKSKYILKSSHAIVLTLLRIYVYPYFYPFKLLFSIHVTAN